MLSNKIIRFKKIYKIYFETLNHFYLIYGEWHGSLFHLRLAWHGLRFLRREYIRLQFLGRP